MNPLLVCLAALATALLPVPTLATTSAGDVLVFTRTAKFRHESIPEAVDALRSIADAQGLRIEHSEDPALFTPQRLATYRTIVFANTTGDVLDEAQQAALRAYIEGGGGFLGIHAAADTEYDWPWYGELVGAWFHKHPPGLQTTQVTLADGTREPWSITDEIYNYRRNPRPWVQVLATVDESRYSGGTMGSDHPIAWCRTMGKGRSWYTGLGHDAAVFQQAEVLALLRRGLGWTTGQLPAC